MDIGSVEKGAAAFAAASCVACHAVDDTTVRNGPPVGCTYERAVAGHPDFPYSATLADNRETRWTAESLDAFLSEPDAWSGGTAMAGAAVPDQQDRADIIAYLASLALARECSRR